MSDAIGRGVIEVVADTSKFKAGMAEAKKSINGLGESTRTISKSASDSIDRYVRRLDVQAATLGKSTRETKLYELAARGASRAQLAAADSALRLAEAHERGLAIGTRLRAGLLAIGTAAAVGTIAAIAAFDNLIKKAGDFQDLAEKTGDTSENLATLALAAGTTSTSMESIAAASVKLTKGLVGVDDETKGAGAAIAALGLDIEAFKKLKPADQFDAVAKALSGFADGTEKTAVAVALYGKSGADLLTFLRELGQENGRQKILTEEQIRLADDYTDRQARLRTEIGLHAQAIATGLLPQVNELTSSIAELVKDQEFAATASAVLNGAFKAGVAVFQLIALAAVNVGFVFKAVGTEIGAIAAQLVALATLDFSGFTAIGDAVREDAVRARKELDRFNTRVLSIGEAAPKFADPRILGTVPSIADQAAAMRPKLNFQGAADKGKKGKMDNTIAQEAKAQLAFDLDQIKKATEGTTNTIANAERIMQAQRAAGLIEERQYYAARLDLLNRNSAAEEAGLQAELDRLQREKLVGKDKIDNDRKIADVQAQLAKARENASANVRVLQIQEAAALRQVAQGYRDAEDAAQAYLGTLTIANARALAGLGAGNQARDRTAGRAQIEDKFSQQRQDLEKSRRDSQLNGTFGPDAQKQYDDELARIRRFQSAALAEYDVFFARRIAMERDWTIGAQEALTNYATDSLNISTQVEALFTNAFQGMEDALVNFVTTGKLSFTGLANSIIADITRIIIKQQILTPLSESISGGMSSGGGFGGLLGTLASSLFGGGGFGSGMANPFAKIVTGGSMRAIGGPVSAGGLYQVNERGPGELLQVAGRQYLMMGSQGGQVSPGTGLSSKTVNITVNQSFAAGTSRQTSTQAAADARRALEAGARNM